MKRLLISLIIIVSSINAQGGRFTINGQISNLRGTAHVGFSYLKMRDGLWEKVSVDSVIVHDGKFSVAGDVDGLTAASIQYGHHKYRIYVEPCAMSVIIDAHKPYFIQQTGTSVDKEIKMVQQCLKTNDSILYAVYEDCYNHPLKLQSGRELFSHYLEACHERLDILIKHFEEHPQSPIGSDLLLQALMLGRNTEFMQAEHIGKLRKHQSDSVRHSLMGKILDTYLSQVLRAECFRKTPVGKTTPDFIGISLSGDTVQLSKMTMSSDVLLYFYTSHDRRHQEIDYIRSYIENIHKDDITILGIDLQTDREKSRKYAMENGICWPVIKDSWADDLYQMGEWTIASFYPVDTELPIFFLIEKGGRLSCCKNISTLQVESFAK